MGRFGTGRGVERPVMGWLDKGMEMRVMEVGFERDVMGREAEV